LVRPAGRPRRRRRHGVPRLVHDPRQQPGPRRRAAAPAHLDHEERERDREHDRALRRLDLEQQLEQARFERRDEWHGELRNTMLAAAADLSGVLGSALLTAEFLRDNEVRSTAKAMDADLRAAPALISRVRLLFRPSSPPADAAVLAHVKVEHLLTTIKALAALEGRIASDETSDAVRERAVEQYAQGEERFVTAREDAREALRTFNEATSAALWQLGDRADRTTAP
jgi:hypothetical protein